MPKITTPSTTRHANADRLNQRFLRGVWQSSVVAVKCCKTVSCPRCKAAKGWPCFSAAGNDSSTPHSARWEAFRETQPSSLPQADGSQAN